MKIRESALAATTNNITKEMDAWGAADLLEFRMDKAANPINQLSKYNGNIPIIATNRTRWFGGQATDTGRLDSLFSASRFDAVKFVDIELETVRSKSWITHEFRENDVDLIISHHDFDNTPSREIIDKIFEQCARYGDIAKVATFPQDQTDTLALLEAVNAATEKGIDVAGISMGKIGSHTRVIGHLYGSKLSYAPLLADDTDYAPGQIPLEKLASLIEITKNNGVDDQVISMIEDEVSVPKGLTL
ncbi:type I 3-dehydroquinate dehydratase [Halocatena pleomorpha]|uniref:3-dehydroquinate dehydratase n=1 Tax=Halocatena pleomorpha TaxID=1785090 RepID=A0A3P3RAQ6_9EURY|nr:type I 3-dehydroquinate dehydratase [Halocatena pleomorpha]RRJ29513.1 type I 3-dehydroquinate dehydratase [Halocatena pleomorpha]